MKKSFYFSFVAFLFFLLGFNSTGFAEISEIRISGDTRFDTAVEISKAAFDTSDTVILSTSRNFPDALAGGPLAYQKDAPILLSSVDSLGTATTNEILRLEAKKAIILGGPTAISAKVEKELEYIGVSVERISGNDRYVTATEIANTMTQTDTAIIAYGSNFPDALAIAPYAAKEGYPILLVKTDSIPSSTKEYLKNVKNTIVIGGTTIISKEVEAQLPNPTRIAGADRFQTNAKIIEQLQADSFTSYVSTGYNFADALTGSVLAAKDNAALLLVRPDSLPSPIHHVLNTKKFSEAIPLGGVGAVSNDVVEKITSLIINNSMETALVIGNGNYTSHLISRTDRDFYKVNMEKSGNINFSMERNQTADWFVTVFDKDGQEIGNSEVETGTGTFSIDFGVPKGEVYLRVSDDIGADDTYDDNERYTFSIALDYSKQYEEELNDSISSATLTPLNTEIQGAIQKKNSGNDRDFYQFTTLQDGNITLSFNRNENADWFISLFDKDGNVYGYSEVESGKGLLEIDFGLPAGQYYMSVVDDTGSSDTFDENENYNFIIKYEASERYEKEFNNEMSSASKLKMDGVFYEGTIQDISTTSGDIDFYEFEVLNPGNVTINMKEAANSDWILTVYASNGTEIGYTEIESGTSTRELMLGLPKGTYYIKIQDDLGASDTPDDFEPYSLSLNYENSNYFEKEINNSFTSATSIEVDKSYSGAIQGLSRTIDFDYYEFNVTEQSTITFEMKQGEYQDWVYSIYDESLSFLGEYVVKAGIFTYSQDFKLLPGKYYIKFSDANRSYHYKNLFEPYTFKLITN